MLGEVKQFAKLRKDGRCLRSEAWGLKGMDLVPGSKNPTLLLVVAKFSISGPQFPHLSMGSANTCLKELL